MYGPPPQARRSSGLGIGCAIVSVIALIVIGGLVGGGFALYHYIGRLPGGFPGTHKQQFQTVDGLNRVMDITRKRFGDTMGYQLSVSPESFTVTRVDPDNPQHTVEYWWYSWKGDFVDPSRGVPYDTAPVDLSKFDANAAIKVLNDAPNMLHVDPAAVRSTGLTIRAAGLTIQGIPAPKQTPAGEVEMEVLLSTSKGSGSIVLTADGTVKKQTSDF